MIDLVQYAREGLHFLAHNVDRRRNCLPFFLTVFKDDPAEAHHDWPDFGDLTARYLEAFYMAHDMTGSDEGLEVRQALEHNLLSYFDENDGLNYRPEPDKPYYSYISKGPYDLHVAEMFDQSRTLMALATALKMSGEPRLKTALQDMVNGLRRICIFKDNYAYYSQPYYDPGYAPSAGEPAYPNQSYFTGPHVQALVQVYETTGDESALDLAQRLARWYFDIAKLVDEDGSFRASGAEGFGTAELNGHTHSRMGTAAGAIRLGTITGDHRMLEIGKTMYDHFNDSYCASFGWSPEFLGRYGIENEGCETCTIMDQINAAAALAMAGYTEYWNHVERIARNQLIEQQIQDTHLFCDSVEKEDTDLSVFHGVADMVRGGFGGWCAPNDFVGHNEHSWQLMNCCGPSGIRGLWTAWHHIEHGEHDPTKINVLMARKGQTVDLEDFTPREGRLVIQVKQAIALSVRIPAFLAGEVPAAKINGADSSPIEKAGYIPFGRLAKGDEVEITYPIKEIKENLHVNGRDFTATWAGDTVVALDPPGERMPLYQRDPWRPARPASAGE